MHSAGWCSRARRQFTARPDRARWPPPWHWTSILRERVSTHTCLLGMRYIQKCVRWKGLHKIKDFLMWNETRLKKLCGFWRGSWVWWRWQGWRGDRAHRATGFTGKWAALGCTGPCSAVLDCTGLFYTVMGCTRLNWAVLGYTGLHWATLDCNGIYWALLVFTGL